MRGFGTTVAVAVLLSSWPVEAQTRYESDTGSHIGIPKRAEIPDSSRMSDDDRARVTLGQFARCTVDRKATQLGKALKASAADMDGRTWQSIADGECLSGGELSFRPILLRGAIFAELYRRRAMDTASGRTWRFPVVPYDRTAPATGGAESGLLAFADCVVRADADDASEFVLSAPVSRAEQTSLDALRPKLAGCLSQGQTISLSKPILSGALGEILYRGTASENPTTSSGRD